MQVNKPANHDLSSRAHVVSGIAIALAAMIGVQAAIPSGGLTRRASSEGLKTVATGFNPIYESSGIVALAGASVLVVAWLHRQSLRCPLAARLPRLHSVARPGANHQPRARKFSTSYHCGGLYGP